MKQQMFSYDETCTCEVEDGDEGHKEGCGLFLCSDWLDGYATWYRGALWDTEELWGWSDEDQVEIDLVKDNTKPADTSTKAWESGWGDYYGAAGGSFGSSCDHDGTTALEYPDGVLIYPSSSYSSTKGPPSIPDYALYLETSRMPYSATGYIPWKDFGLPTIDFRHTAEMIIDAYALAKDGMTVEVGCIGGHGRTGTVLACMAILADIPLDDAVEWVRTNH